MDHLFELIVGSYAFTLLIAGAGVKGFLYLLTRITNHIEHRFQDVEARLTDLEDED